MFVAQSNPVYRTPKTVIASLLAGLLLSAVPAIAEVSAVTESTGEVQTVPVKSVAVPGPAKSLTAREGSGRLLVQAVYQVLLGEIALSRGQGDVAFAAWNDLAVKSEDPFALRRAIEIAVSGQRFDLAFPLVSRWRALAPTVPEAQYAFAQIADRTGKPQEALQAVQEARRLNPAWAQPWILEAQLKVAANDLNAAVGLMQTYLQQHPSSERLDRGNLESRQYLARLLVNTQRYAEARDLFQALSREWPESAELRYPVAILSLQINDVKTAKAEFQSILEMPHADPMNARYFLGQIAEHERDSVAALGFFQGVTRGENWLNARLRVTRLLREAGQESQALAELEGLLDKMPDHPELLYETALLAEKLGQIEKMEAHFRRLLTLQPDNALALNALGYSLADHRLKLDEANALVVKALALQPEDPFIMDSLGWVLFRQGKLEDARQQLELAYRKKADPEIAAHLGEVLWALQQQQAAHALWQAALARHPENSLLRNTILRFVPQGLTVSMPVKPPALP